MEIKLASVMVNDQDKALRFYTEKLGFVKKVDNLAQKPQIVHLKATFKPCSIPAASATTTTSIESGCISILGQSGRQE